MNKLTKVLLCVILCAIALCSVAALAACDNEPAHTHEWAADFTVDKAATCTEAGSKSIHCNGCDETKDVTVIPANGHREAVKHDETASSCATDGAEAYWECPDCHKMYSDEACQHEISQAEIIPAAHKLVHHDAVAKSCTTAGAEEYWECSACHKLYSDENAEHEIAEAVVIPAAHELVHHDAAAKSCATDGSEEYWECSACHKLYSDEACEHEISEPQAIPASHGTLVYHAKVDNACDVEGVEAYWECPDCHKLYSDEECEHEISEPQTIQAKGHVGLIHHEAIVANCLTGGAEAYWECPVCNRFYSDEQCSNLIEHAQVLPINPNNHDGGVKAVAEVSATCTENGTEGYYRCVFCNKLYSDAECENEILLARTIPAAGHDFDEEWTIDVEATCMDDGSKSHHCLNEGCNEKTDITAVEARGYHGEAVAVAADSTDKKTITTLAKSSISFTRVAHYVCPDCNKKFSDAELTKEVTAVYMHSRNGNLLELGNNIVFSHATAYSTFYADANGLYTFTVEGDINFITLAVAAETSPTVYSASKWDSEAVTYNRFLEHPDTVEHTISVYLKKGECLILRTSNKESTILVEKTDVLMYGDSNINITVANSVTDVDVYDFIPFETKTYSLTVPAGIGVILVDSETILINDKGYTQAVNIACQAFQKVSLSFIGEVGTYKVTFGEEICLKIAAGETLSNINVPAKGVTVLEVGDDVEEGTYTLTITLASVLGRSLVYFGKNIEADFDEIYGPDSAYGMGGTAEVTYQNNMPTTRNGADYTVKSAGYAKFTITLTLKAGDKLVFAHSNTVDGTITVALSEAV